MIQCLKDTRARRLGRLHKAQPVSAVRRCHNVDLPQQVGGVGHDDDVSYLPQAEYCRQNMLDHRLAADRHEYLAGNAGFGSHRVRTAAASGQQEDRKTFSHHNVF